MDSSDTYNRVKQIEASTCRVILKAINSLLFTLFATSLAAAFLAITPFIPSLVVAAIAALAFIGIWYIIANRDRNCRFCGNALHHINRSMILSAEYLSMQGVKKGDFYFAPCKWGKKHSPTGWAKISHRAIACHHCRISREGYHPFFEPVSEHELAEIKPI